MHILEIGEKSQLIARRHAVQVVGDFLRFALQYVGQYFESRENTFIVPTRWSEQEIGLYADAIKICSLNEPFRILNTIEAGALCMVRYLQKIPNGSGVMFLTDSEGSILHLLLLTPQ